jgi:hypothetical protein
MMSKEEKVLVFESLAQTFETLDMRNYYLDMCQEIPDYIFTMPSSTSGRFHNKAQCERFGQINHIFMFHSILEHRLRLEHNKAIFKTPTIRDCMRCVPTFHDAIKCGWNGSQYTLHKHPLMAGEWIRNIVVGNDIKDEYKNFIADMCERHSGEWNSSPKDKTLLPKPEKKADFFIHECDILSSRNDLDYIMPEKVNNTLGNLKTIEPIPTLENYVLPFGKHIGKTLIEISQIDPGYIYWAKDNITKEPVKTLLESIGNKEVENEEK